LQKSGFSRWLVIGHFIKFIGRAKDGYGHNWVAFGHNTLPISKPLENTDLTLASKINLRRDSKASMRIDAAATQPVFGRLCH